MKVQQREAGLLTASLDHRFYRILCFAAQDETKEISKGHMLGFINSMEINMLFMKRKEVMLMRNDGGLN